MQFDAKLLSAAPAPSKIRVESDEIRSSELQALISHNIDSFDDDDE